MTYKGSRRYKCYKISAEALQHIFAQGAHPQGYEIVENGFPEDAHVVMSGIYPTLQLGMIDPQLYLLVWSASFDEVAEGAEIPSVTPLFRRIETLGPREQTVGGVDLGFRSDGGPHEDLGYNKR